MDFVVWVQLPLEMCFSIQGCILKLICITFRVAFTCHCTYLVSNATGATLTHGCHGTIDVHRNEIYVLRYLPTVCVQKSGLEKTDIVRFDFHVKYR